jgi:enoyl-CoA hydratase
MSDLLCHEEDGIVVLTMNRAKVKNAINGGIMTGLAEQTAMLRDRDDVNAVILTGAGGESFCAGGDLKWLQRYDSGEGGEEMSRRMQRVLNDLASLPMPIIGVVNGYAFGGGAEIAVACDLRIMEEHSFLCFKQVQAGIMTGWGGGGRLRDLVGYARALEFVITCPKVHPEQALNFGLTNAIAPTGQGMEMAKEMTERIRRGAPRSVRAMKHLLRSGRGRGITEAAEVEANLFRTIWASPDHNEALDAFFGKRRPEFKGR